jgi:hypothetical protein
LPVLVSPDAQPVAFQKPLGRLPERIVVIDEEYRSVQHGNGQRACGRVNQNRAPPLAVLVKNNPPS